MRTILDLIHAHAGRDIFVVGSGTSLAGFDFSSLADEVTIALNGAIAAEGFTPTYHLLADEWLIERLGYLWTRATTVVVPMDSAHLLDAEKPCATWLQVSRQIDTSQPAWTWPSVDVVVDSAELYCVHTISIAGAQLAYKLGAARIFLLGLDGYATPRAAYFDGSAHRFPVDDRGARDLGDGRVVAMKHAIWRHEHAKLREWFAGLGYDQVYNCSEKSTIDAWPKVALTTALRR